MKEIKTPLQIALKHQLGNVGNIERVQLNQVLTEAHVSKTTFYRYYRDKYDLLNSIVADISKQTFQKSEQSYVTQLRDGLLKVEKNKHLFCDALKYQGQNSIETTLITYAKTYVTDLNSQHHAYAVGQTQEFAITFYCFGMVGVIKEWVLSDCTTAPQKLAKQIAEQMPQSLKTILLY